MLSCCHLVLIRRLSSSPVCNATIGCADARRRVIRIKCKKGLNPLTHYRRIYAPGATGFFTVNIAKRRNNRLLVENIEVLRTAFYDVKKKHPFRIEAALISSLPMDSLTVQGVPLGWWSGRLFI